jgi:hypothetical protein
MPIVATTIHMLENMFIRNIPDPAERPMEFYRQTLPPPSEFAHQAEELCKPDECYEILLFAKLAAEVCPDGNASPKR